MPTYTHTHTHTHTHTLPPPLQPGLEPPFLEEEPWEQQTEALRQGAKQPGIVSALSAREE